MNKKNLLQKLNQAQALINECLVFLESMRGKKSGLDSSEVVKKEKTLPKNKDYRVDINFSLHPRAFFKKYNKRLSGPKKFTLVAAYLLKGDSGISISAEKIIDCWDKNFVLLGGKKITSRTYGTRAKEDGWLDSKKYGFYELTSIWQKIFD